MALFLTRFLEVHVRLELVELTKNFEATSSCHSWFRLQSMAIHCSRRRVLTDTPHTSFFSCTSHALILYSPHGSSVCMRASPHIHAIHDERLRVCSSLLLRSDLLRVSLLHLSLLFPRHLTPAPPPTEEACTLAGYTPPTPSLRT